MTAQGRSHAGELQRRPGREDASACADHSRDSALEQRVQTLTAFYDQVRRERMHGLAIVNPALRVQALGFQWVSGSSGQDITADMAEGVLITPWFMSLLRLPSDVQAHQNRVGRSQTRAFGCECFDFIGAHDAALGYHETCALFSPMHDFDTQQLACDTAREVLAALRPRRPAPAPVPAPAPPTRRAFFFGREAK